MRILDRLKKEARESAKFRGHKLGRFTFEIEPESSRIIGCYICKKCGKSVFINTRPMPNQIDVGGAAVALGCEDEY